tara:strand:- start:759 stop:2039 length:1281 start_codon:yes stop_codon:yes gene_type:complete
MMGAAEDIRADEFIEFEYQGKTVRLPLITGTEGEVAVDISKLRAETGLITLDGGYVNTGACKSEITFLNGELGILRHRGYAIEDLVENHSFLDVAFLLIYGELPSAGEAEAFHGLVADSSRISEDVARLIKAQPSGAHPMGVLSSVLGSFNSVCPQLDELEPSAEQELELFATLMAQFNNIIAAQYRIANGQDPISSKLSEFGYGGDFFNMMFGKTPSDTVKNVLNKLLILHADHEQNCSTSAVRLVGSSKANLSASIASGVNALWGPLHGGANQAVIEMLSAISEEGGETKHFLERAKDKNDPFKLMGFGHRVYKNFDPRAKLIKASCDSVLEELSVQDPLLKIAKDLEEEALRDSYFVERKLYPNVDFYSGIVYRALGVPVNMFTAMFALGRLPGWLAQWREMRHSKGFRIGRPRQIYTGKKLR